jgi:hypothetical protein
MAKTFACHPNNKKEERTALPIASPLVPPLESEALANFQGRRPQEGVAG